jgi:hypothetical protein
VAVVDAVKGVKYGFSGPRVSVGGDMWEYGLFD